MVHPMLRPNERWTRTACRIGDPRAVAALAEADLLGGVRHVRPSEAPRATLARQSPEREPGETKSRAPTMPLATGYLLPAWNTFDQAVFRPRCGDPNKLESGRRQQGREFRFRPFPSAECDE